jgi:hypothetical protein
MASLGCSIAAGLASFLGSSLVSSAFFVHAASEKTVTRQNEIANINTEFKTRFIRLFLLVGID